MKDLQDIIALARAEVAAFKPDADAVAAVGAGAAPRAALATLVSVDGSSYRRPGASMLITPGGRRAGGISGGCLERDVERHAREVLASGQPRVVTYDTKSEADLLVGTGLGCGGRLEILVEPIDLTAEHSPVTRWAAALERREALAELIVVSAASAAPAHAGSGDAGDDADRHAALRGGAERADRHAAPRGDAESGDRGVPDASSEIEAAARARAIAAPVVALPQGWRLFLWSHAAADGGPALTHSHLAQDVATSGAAPPAPTHASLDTTIAQAREAAREALAGGRSTGVMLDTPDGPVHAFVRIVIPPVQLIVCGAGDDTIPLERMASTLGWYVWMLDHRAAFATRDRFPQAAQVEVVITGELPANLRLDARTVAVVMNHNFAADSAWLRALAPRPLAYLGLLGARSRTERLMRETELDRQPHSALRHIFAPAGLDIGAEGADQIALSIVSEIQSVLTGRPGTSMRDRDRPPASTTSHVLASETSEVM